MRATTTTIGMGAVLAAAVCLLAAPSARAVVPICASPSDVPAQMLASIDTTCFNCTKNGTPVIQNPCPPVVVLPGDVWVKTQCYEFPEDPTQEICDRIASEEVVGCQKAVQSALKCNTGLNAANASTETAVCQTLPDPTAQKTCANEVAAELAALTSSLSSAAAAGLQACVDLKSSVRATCLGP